MVVENEAGQLRLDTRLLTHHSDWRLAVRPKLTAQIDCFCNLPVTPVGGSHPHTSPQAGAHPGDHLRKFMAFMH